jgi:hypothetical protein
LKKSALLFFCYFLSATAWSEGKDTVQAMIQSFKSSNIEFQRGNSLVPFFPLATLGVTSYGSTDIEINGQSVVAYDVEQFNQAAGLPILIDDDNVLVVGEYIARTKFSTSQLDQDSFQVNSFGLPIGWLRQVDSRWQVTGFIMPLAHKSSQTHSDWNWQVLGGVYGRYVQSDTTWWAFGFYADIGSGEDTYLPYLGASWNLNEHWTLSAIMPWPAILYAPNKDWLLRLGASPSGASWQVSDNSTDILINFDAWDFGFSVKRRMVGNVWLSFESGVGGLRGLHITGGNMHGTDTSVSSSTYIGLNINFRPAIN